MRRGTVIAALSFAFGLSYPAFAQQRADQGDWPCRQVRVPSVAIGSVWTGPAIDDNAKASRDDAAIGDLAARLGARRTPIDEAQRLIGDFAKASGDKRKERLAALFSSVYERLESERREVLAGLDRYGRKQKELAEKLRGETQSLRAEQDKTPSDAQKVKEASEALQWDLRVFDERRHALGYVCETPALIEQRLGALARAIEAAID